MCVITDDNDDERYKKEVDFVPFEPTENGAQTEVIISDLVLACEAALLLRGITTAILDPLALAGEKQAYRLRYKEIEREIRAAIERATTTTKK